jgi:hypothetical protein
MRGPEGRDRLSGRPKWGSVAGPALGLGGSVCGMGRAECLWMRRRRRSAGVRREFPGVSAVRWVCAVVAALMLVACGGGSKASGTGSTTSSVQASTAASALSTTVAAVAGGELGSKIVPPPAGYEVSTSSDATNGPLTPAMLDKTAGQPGLAAALHLVGGYGKTYDAISTSESLEIDVLQLTSKADAGSVLRLAALTVVDSSEEPKQTDTRAVPGGIAVDGTKAASDGFFSHAIVAAKGARVMVVVYSVDQAGPAPSLLTTTAVKQYSRI